MIFSYLLNMQSHPSWVCGLKLGDVSASGNVGRSHPSWVCGLKLQVVTLVVVLPVTPFVGVWIETASGNVGSGAAASHTLRGCVD